VTNKRVKKLDPSAAAKYIAKAREFAESMRRSAAAEEWDAAGLGAVHSVISAADALLAAYGGIRSIEPDHRMAIRLLEETLGRDAISSARRHISFVIAKKNVIEYEQRRMTEQEGRSIVQHAERFLKFSKKMLGAIG
jgi:uncharacterized protein (UPF0332 family)